MSNHFNKTISVKKGTALYVGAVLGSGILILPGMTASVAEGNAIASLAPEFKTPRKRNIIFSTGFAIVIIGFLYIGIALSVIGTKSYHINADNTTALVLVIKQTLGEQFAWIIGFVAFIICLGTTNAFIASMGRLGYSLGQEEVAPRYLAHINKKRETPTNAIKVVGCIAIIGLLISFVFQISIDNIVLIPNSLGIITYLVGTAAGMKLIKNKLGKNFSIVAFTYCIAVYPFIGGVILIPVAISFLCLCYLRFSSRSKKYK